jgi:hypothetical protein
MEPDEGALQSGSAATVRVRTGLHLLVDGHLNPLIFAPGWFGKEGLLRPEEVESAKASVSADSTFLAFRTSEFSFVVSLSSLEVFTNSEGHEPVLRDLMLNIFSLLRYTPLSALTISRSAHLAHASDPSIVPKWSALMPTAPLEQALGKALIVDITAKGSEGPVPEQSEVTLSIQPSRVDGASLFIECKYSYALDSDEHIASAEMLNDRLKNVMETTRDHSESAFTHFSDLLLTTQATLPGDSRL